MSKKTKGRLKIKMEYIPDKLKRFTTFSKRRSGIMKKAYELSTLTGTEVLLLVASETGHVYTYATDKLKPIFTSDTGRQLIQQCLGAEASEQGGANTSSGDRHEFRTGLYHDLNDNACEGGLAEEDEDEEAEEEEDDEQIVDYTDNDGRCLQQEQSRVVFSNDASSSDSIYLLPSRKRSRTRNLASESTQIKAEPLDGSDSFYTTPLPTGDSNSCNNMGYVVNSTNLSRSSGNARKRNTAATSYNLSQARSTVTTSSTSVLVPNDNTDQIYFVTSSQQNLHNNNNNNNQMVTNVTVSSRNNHDKVASNRRKSASTSPLLNVQQSHSHNVTSTTTGHILSPLLPPALSTQISIASSQQLAYSGYNQRNICTSTYTTAPRHSHQQSGHQ